MNSYLTHCNVCYVVCVAVLLSVFCIFIFGEIFPTAFFTGPGQLLMAGRCHNIVKWMMWLLYPLTYPISSALDYLFSHDEHDSTISRAELSAMIALQSADHVSVLQTEGDTAIDIGTDTDIDAAARVHGNINTDQYGGVGVTLNERTPLKTPQVGHGHTHSHAHAHGRAPLMSPVTNNLKQTEVRIMTSILQLAGTTLRHALIPTAHTGTDSGAPATVFSLCGSTKLDRRTLLAISRTGYSRVPIYFEHRRRFVGYILTKSLLEVDPADCLPVASLPLRQPLVISPDVSLLHLLDLFKTGRCNIAFISNSPDLTVKYIQHKLQVESYLDQQCARSNSQSYSRAETEALGGPSSENRQHENSILSPVKHFSHNNTCVDSVDDTSLLDSHGKLSASDIVLARELNLLSGAETETAITNAAAALKSMEIVGIITLQDVLQKIFGGHHLHDSDSLQSGNKYTRVHTPVRSTVHHLSFSDDSINVSSSAFNSTNNSAVKVEHASDIVGCGGGSSSDVEQGQVLFTADTDQLLTKE